MYSVRAVWELSLAIFLDFSQSICIGDEGVSVRCVTATALSPVHFSSASDTAVFIAAIYSKTT